MEKRKGYNKSDSAYIFFASIVIVQVIVLFVYIIYSAIAKHLGVELNAFSEYTIVKYINTIFIQIIFLFIFFNYNKRKKIDFLEATKFRKDLNIKSLLLIIVIALICLFGFLPLVNLTNHILKLIGVNITEGLLIPINNFWQFSIAVLFMAVFPAFAEEFIFRGIIFNGFLKNTTPKKAIILSSVIFCIMHLNVQQTVYSLILGIVLALMVYYTGSLLSSIITHFINNFVVVLFNYINRNVISEEIVYNNFLSYFVPILIAGIVAVVLFFLFKILKNLNSNVKIPQYTNYVVEDKNGFNSIIKNPDFIIICTFIVALLFWTSSFFN